MMSVLRTEGPRAFFIGMGPFVARGAVMTATQVASYDHVKSGILEAGWMQDGLGLYLTSSMLAGLVTATAISPFDIVKTLMMAQRTYFPVDPIVWLHSSGLIWFVLCLI